MNLANNTNFKPCTKFYASGKANFHITENKTIFYQFHIELQTGIVCMTNTEYYNLGKKKKKHSIFSLLKIYYKKAFSDDKNDKRNSALKTGLWLLQ